MGCRKEVSLEPESPARKTGRSDPALAPVKRWNWSRSRRTANRKTKLKVKAMARIRTNRRPRNYLTPESPMRTARLGIVILAIIFSKVPLNWARCQEKLLAPWRPTLCHWRGISYLHLDWGEGHPPPEASFRKINPEPTPRRGPAPRSPGKGFPGTRQR